MKIAYHVFFFILIWWQFHSSTSISTAIQKVSHQTTNFAFSNYPNLPAPCHKISYWWTHASFRWLTACPHCFIVKIPHNSCSCWLQLYHFLWIFSHKGQPDIFNSPLGFSCQFEERDRIGLCFWPNWDATVHGRYMLFCSDVVVAWQGLAVSSHVHPH